MGLKKAPRFLALTLGYTLLLQLAFVASLLLRFEGDVPAFFWRGYLLVTPYYTVLSLVGFFAVGLYHGLWRYASTVTLFQILKGVTLSALTLILSILFSGEPLFPRTLIVMVWLWQLVLMGGARFAWRLSRERVLGPMPLRAGRALVVGAGHAGVHLVTEMRRGPAGNEILQPVGIIDDDTRLTGHTIEGVKVLGTIVDLPRVIQEQRPEIVIVSDPELPAKVVREIARFCAEAHVRVKTLPGLSDLHHGRTTLSQMRDVSIEDLLGRQPVQLHLTDIAEFVRSQRVLVTGAGGSIGGELARQVAGFDPARLVMLDHAENGLYYVQNELMALYPSLPIDAVVADIRDPEAMELVHARFRPTLVFHAAAHKHVPLLEEHPREAVLNNVVGTRNLLEAAERHHVEKFVLISSDKAVNPTSVMGATKRVCEMLLQSRSGRTTTRFAAVRFGNVLGSEGSVIPLFERQIQRGGPVTVTHPEARRYFMTIPEAVRLVLQAGSLGRGGEVFLLDMGEQVRIADLARQVIRMAGLEEGKDIELVYTGLRPGEKLFEELHSDAERMRMTRHERILVWELDAPPEARLLEEVAELEARAHAGDNDGIRTQLRRIVPEYREPSLADLSLPAEEPALVELPAAALPGPEAEAPGRTPWPRRALDVAMALVFLVLSAPAWALVWLETRVAGERDPLVSLECVGRTRRWRQRRGARVPATIDRRTIERRTQELFGMPFRCSRLRRDVGPVSRWLARRSLDRLPLLLNVLRGEMALVGPRPATPDEVLRWHALSPEFERRFSVLPGITGLAQLSACSGDGPDGVACRIQYDLYYVDHRSLLLDVRTLARTLKVVLGGPGAPPGRHRLGARREAEAGPGEPDRAASADAIAASASTVVKGVTQ